MAVIVIAAGTAIAYGGLAAISLTMDRHYADIHGSVKEPDARMRLRLRLLGWLGIALSFAACVAADGWATGSILWFGVLTASALLLMLLLQYAPLTAIRLAMCGYPAALLAGMAWLVV
jgi:hypothetical protein